MGVVRETFAALMLSKCCRAGAAHGHAAAGLRCPKPGAEPTLCLGGRAALEPAGTPAGSPWKSRGGGAEDKSKPHGVYMHISTYAFALTAGNK